MVPLLHSCFFFFFLVFFVVVFECVLLVGFVVVHRVICLFVSSMLDNWFAKTGANRLINRYLKAPGKKTKTLPSCYGDSHVLEGNYRYVVHPTFNSFTHLIPSDLIRSQHQVESF